MTVTISLKFMTRTVRTMMLRAPATPLITVDPYFSVGSPSDRLTDSVTMHWTGKPTTILGVAEIDGVPYRFLGRLFPGDATPAMEQTDVQITALSTEYHFRAAGVALCARFTSTLFPDDLPIVGHEKFKCHFPGSVRLIHGNRRSNSMDLPYI